MLIHGRLTLTASGLLLDEVRSLLQKALRRKERDFATQATKELIGRGKDQLPWKSIVTFMFEDHCLNSEEVLLQLVKQHANQNKWNCIELMLDHCNTCRVAACLPVIAMDTEYEPVDWDCNLEVEEKFGSLVMKKASRINFELLLQHLKDAWKVKNSKRLIAYMKLATMVCDHDDQMVTEKGKLYCYYNKRTKKHNPAMVVLTMLSLTSQEMGDDAMKWYCKYCCYLATIPDVPVRLILSAAVAQYIHQADVKQHRDIKLGQGKVNWKSVGKLETIPEWASDKHTFRGKCGKGTQHLLNKKKHPEVKGLTEVQLEEFHGARSKRDISHFFSEGVICVDEVLMENPYWERCQELYLQRPKSLQKTVRMTKVYYGELMKKYPGLKGPKSSDGDNMKEEIHSSKKRKAEEMEEDDDDAGQKKTRKKTKTIADYMNPSTSKNESTQIFEMEDAEKEPSSSEAPDKGSVNRSCVIQENVCTEQPCTDGPLLQLPTGSAKMYTRVDLADLCVWKGPYRADRADLAMYFHRVLREVFMDRHTLTAHRNGPYIRFILLRAADAKMVTTVRDFYDCIGKREVKGGEFILRESLGVIQLHNLDAASLKKVPVTFWCHFMFRYILNIGDSGLYNSLTDKNQSFLYGIDMEEIRKNVLGRDILNLMFSKLPKKQLQPVILSCLRGQKEAAISTMSKQFDKTRIKALAKFYDKEFDEDHFDRRVRAVLRALKNLGGGNL